MKSKKLHHKTRAFSLIEVAVVILIIGIFVAALMTGMNFYKKFKIATAQNLTVSAPINGITQNILWLETSLDKSFNSSETSNGSSLSVWYSVGNQGTQTNATPSGTAPTYANTINYVHAVKFDGSGYFNVDASALNNTDYTIIILEKRQSSSANNYFIGDSSVSTANQSLLLGYSSDGGVIHSQGTSNSYSSAVDSYANFSDKPRIFVFTSDSTLGKKTYINGTLAASSTDTTQLSGLTNLAIGKGYTGEIGEVVIFAKSIKNEDRKVIEDYLSKKWSNKLTRDIAPTCTNGAVAESGCKQICAVSITGVPSTTLIDGATQSFACSQTGYTGSTASYTCTNGALTPTPSATACGCAANYDYLSGTCQQNCTFSGTTGITNGTKVVATSTSTFIPCNATNFSTSAGVTYTCAGGGAPTITSNTCPSSCSGNYSGSTCSSCINNYTTASGCTACLGNYSLASRCTTCSGNYSGATCSSCINNYTTASGCTACAGNYSLASSCTTCNGNYSTSSGCTACSTGYTGASCTSCATNYDPVGSTCQPKCLVSTANGNPVLGIADGTYFSVTSTPKNFTCNGGAGVSGSINYTCSGGTFAVTSGACTVLKCTGGNTSLFTVAGQTIHAFTSGTASLVCYQNVTARVLVVAGGGSGGSGGSSRVSGGGGGGGVAYGASVPLTATTYNITVGNGGVDNSCSSKVAGGSGGSSSISGLITVSGGGGGGGSWQGGAGGGGNGGGGGSSTSNGNGSGNYTSGYFSIYGNNGGAGGCSETGPGGGGGGAGGAGQGCSTSTRTGGIGFSNDISGITSSYGYGGNGGSGSGGGGGGDGFGGGGNGLLTYESCGKPGFRGIVLVRYAN